MSKIEIIIKDRKTNKEEIKEVLTPSSTVFHLFERHFLTRELGNHLIPTLPNSISAIVYLTDLVAIIEEFNKIHRSLEEELTETAEYNYYLRHSGEEEGAMINREIELEDYLGGELIQEQKMLWELKFYYQAFDYLRSTDRFDLEMRFLWTK